MTRMTSTRLPRSVPLRLGLVLAAAGVLALSACASTTEAAPAPAASAAPGGAQNAQPGGGVSGTIAAISGATLQVQDSSSQTAVSYDSSTTITQSVAGTLSDVTNGVCITAITGAFPGSSTSTQPSTSSASSAASVVTIVAAVDGACTSGFGGGPGGAGGTPPTDLPSGVMPSGAPDGVMPSGAPGGAFGGFAGGLVTAVSGSTITVQSMGSDGTASSSEVTVDSSTTYTKTETADSTALVVGACVTARGASDSSGAVAATSLMVSTPGDSGCSIAGGPGGFGGRPGSGTTTSGS